MRLFFKILMVSFFLFPPQASVAVEEHPVNTISVRFDTARHLVQGISEITLPQGKTWVVDLAGLTVISASINNMAFTPDRDAKVLSVQTGAAADTLRIEYEVSFTADPETDREKNPGVVQGNLVSAAGIYLADGWYPVVRGQSRHRLTAVVPAGFEAISEADEITARELPGKGREFSFSFPHPVGGITLVAAAYRVEKVISGNIQIYTYFLPEDAGLAANYSEHTKKYLSLYEGLLGPYPYKRFSVVENILPTGISLPTFTLLGREVVRLPFIVETSLGHEVLHQWFGNLVYISSQGGNWAEGITTYLADHWYEEEKGRGWDYRKQALISLESYVNADNDSPLAAFSGRTDRASRAVGYGKAAMVFHMLRRHVGDDLFFASLKAFVQQYRFMPASWDDIRVVFSKVTGKDLGWFFRQWLEEKGAPEIGLKNAVLQYRGARAEVSFAIVQKGKQFRIQVPVLLKLRDGEVRKTFEIEKELTALSLDTEGSPVELVIDEQYDMLRRLSEPEFPPVVSRLIGDPKKTFVIPSGKEGDYAGVSAFLSREGYAEKKENDITFDDMREASLIMVEGTALQQRFFAKAGPSKGDFSISIKENPFGGRDVVALISIRSPEELSAHLQRIAHYGKYSVLLFEGGRNTLKSVAESRRGVRSTLSPEVTGVVVPRMVDLAEVVREAGKKEIVYVGEMHDRFAHHRVQLEVIRALHEAGRKVAVGMEMFQRPFQSVLDDYINGRIGEREFLKKSEYFKRWGFDYNLYREILLYAREYRIPVIALNIRREIVSKVSKEGLSALTMEELAEIPPDMDLTDSVYRDRLRQFFEGHQEKGEKNFDFFYEAQVLWDESMAHNLDRFVRERPDHQVVVLAGIGHLAFGSGIPKRSHRLNGKGYALILNTDDVERSIADFVLFPEPIPYNKSPILGVMLKEENKKMVISGFSPNSIAEKAGLKENDTILSIDGYPVESLEDLKIILLEKKKGDEVAAKVLRKRFLFGDEEKVYKVTF